MRILTLHSIFIVILFHSSPLKSQVAYEYIIGNSNDQEVFNDIAINEDGFVFALMSSTPIDKYDSKTSSVIYKFSPDGDTIRYNPQKPDTIISLRRIILTNHGNFIVAGDGYLSKKKSNSGLNMLNDSLEIYDFEWFCEFTSDFDVVWEKSYHLFDSAYTGPAVIKAKADSGYYYMASVVSELKLKTNVYVYLFEFGSDGDSIAFSIFPKSMTSQIFSATIDEDNPNLLIHQVNTVIGSPYPCRMVEFNASLDSVSSYTYPSQLFSKPFYTIMTNNKKFVSAGWDYTGFEEHIGVIKFDTTNGLIKKTLLTPGDKGVETAWVRTMDNYHPELHFVTGIYNRQIVNVEPNWIYVAALNNNLDLIHEEYYGGDYCYDTWAISATPDGGAVIAGRIDFLDVPGMETYDAYILKLDSMMFVGLEDKLSEKETDIKVYPNPATSRLFLEISESFSQLKIYNLYGKLVQSEDISTGTHELNIKHLPCGVYSWVLSNSKNAMKSGLFIKN
jgi:hypothetical protein